MKSNYWKALAVLAAGAGTFLSVERVAAVHSEDWDRDGRTLQGTWVVTDLPSHRLDSRRSGLAARKTHTIISLRLQCSL